MPKVVYLDTSDFSRFGDVIRGKSDKATEKIFAELRELRAGGEAIFPCSMPIISELIQYSDETKDICLAKADAVEILCGSWAMAFPSRSVAMEIAEAYTKIGVSSLKAPIEYINDERYWYPNVGDVFSDIRKNLKAEVDRVFSSRETNTFTQRRKLKKLKAQFDVRKFVNNFDYSAVEAELGLPAQAVKRSIIPLVLGRITPNDASRELFKSIAEPRRFVELFYGRGYEGSEKLPLWITGMGAQLKEGVDRAVQKTESFRDYPNSEGILRGIFSEQAVEYAKVMPAIGYGDLSEFVDGPLLAKGDRLPPAVQDQMPSPRVLAQAFHGYMEQILGLMGSRAKFERSVAGDLIHLLYLPHVDLWRGDRRFSAVLHRKLPELKHKVVARLSDLPDKILR